MTFNDPLFQDELALAGLSGVELLLVQAALEARSRAYCPYSQFAVGAAILDEQGEIHAGCNVENLSFGLTICAERTAMGRLIAAGGKMPVCVAVVADTDQAISPCGACRQVLAEFNPELPLLLVNGKGRCERFSLSILFPRAATGILNRE